MGEAERQVIITYFEQQSAMYRALIAQREDYIFRSRAWTKHADEGMIRSYHAQIARYDIAIEELEGMISPLRSDKK